MLALAQGGDAVGGGLDVEAVEEAAPDLGQGERDAQLLGDREAEVLHRLQDVGEVERPDGAELDGGRLRRPGHDARLEAALERFQLAEVGGHLLRRGHLAVEPAARLRRHVAAEEAPPLPLPELLLEGGGHPVLPVGHERLGQPARLLDVHRVLELVRVEVEDEERHRSAVHRGAEGDRPEGGGERPAQRRLGLVRVAQAREGHVERLVARPAAALDHQLLVARDLDDLLDHALEVGGLRVEEVGLGEVVEGGARLTPAVRARDPAAALEDAVVLLLEQRNAVGALRERSAREAPEQQREAAEPAVLPPLAHGQVLDRLEVVDGGGVRTEVEIQDPVVARLGVEVLLDVLDDAGEHHRQQRRVAEDAGRRLVHALKHPVGPRGVGHRAHEDVVVVLQPLQEGAGRGELARVAAARAQPWHQLAAGAPHVLEVVDRQEHGLQQREHLVLDTAQPLLRLHRLDVEQAVALLAALRLRVAKGRDALPLAPDGEDRVERGVHAQSGLLQVVLEAVEDERPVGRVGAQHRGLEREAGPAPDPPRVLLAQVGRADVDSRQSLVELVRGRHLARDERVVEPEDSRRDPLGRHRESDPRGHPGEQDRSERQHELALVRRRLALQDVQNLGQPGRALAFVELRHRDRSPRAACRARRS
jgi:hypothetical protein